MSDGKILIDLEPTKDRNGKTIYIGKIKAPLLIDCAEKADGNGGVCFIVFLEEGSEQLQISHISKPKNKINYTESK
jgi:hypothetical protein